jgi:putative transcriptional regulator
MDVPIVKNSVRELREARGWTQVEFGDRLKVSRQTIYAIETGLYDPSLPLALAIAKLLGRPVEEIFRGAMGEAKKRKTKDHQ